MKRELQKGNFRKSKLIFEFLFLLACILIYSSCKTNGGSDGYKLDNEIVSVEPDNVDVSSDSLLTVAGDRLNIVIKTGDKDIHTFAKAFKKSYPEEDYKIIYYDSLTHRIQVELPRESRIRMMKELPKKLNEYELLIWEENLFKTNRTPTDPGFDSYKKSWHLDAIKVKDAWDYSFGNEDIKIAIIDSGFDLEHEELKDRYTNPYNVITKSNKVSPVDNQPHGTHVAGIAVAERDNGFGIAGVVPNCKFIPIQVDAGYGFVTSTALIDAVLYAIHQDADVINMSLETLIDPMIGNLPLSIQEELIRHSFKGQEEFWDQIYEMAEKNKTTIVMAAGNSNMLVGISPMQRHPLGIKVNALDEYDNKARFSNYGAYSTLSTPGVNVYNSFPNNEYNVLDGTSMASPIAAGAVALLKSLQKDLSTREIIQILQKTGKKISDKNGEVGPLIQLSNAVKYLKGENRKTPIIDECADVRFRIEQLQREIAELQRLCPDYKSIEYDTLAMPLSIDDEDLTSGLWMSTTTLQSSRTGEEVTLFFEFNKDGTGTLTIKEEAGDNCYGVLNISIDDGEFIIDQISKDGCDSGKPGYSPYKITCIADKNGKAICTAKNKVDLTNIVDFNMVKIR